MTRAQTNPEFFAVMPDAEFDSFLTIDMDGPAPQPGALSSVGLDFDQWTEQVGINSENGAVFFMDPEHGATFSPFSPFARARSAPSWRFVQLTVRAGTHFMGRISAQGKTAGGGEDWAATGLEFTEAV